MIAIATSAILLHRIVLPEAGGVFTGTGLRETPEGVLEREKYITKANCIRLHRGEGFFSQKHSLAQLQLEVFYCAVFSAWCFKKHILCQSHRECLHPPLQKDAVWCSHYLPAGPGRG